MENVGVSVEFITVTDGSDPVVTDDAFSSKTESVIVKTGKDPIDVSKILKNTAMPYFRIRCIPEFSQRLKWAASEWLEPETITVDRLKGLGLNGWICVPGKWYYFKNGEPLKGWMTLDKKDYYLDPQTGVMQTGWIYENRKWYYFSDSNGALLRDTQTPNGCRIGKDGAWTGLKNGESVNPADPR